MNREKWTGRERDAIMYTVALDDNFQKAEKVLEKRIRQSHKRAWNMWRTARALTTRVVCLLVDTLPDNNVQHLKTLLERSELRFVMPGPIKTPRYCFLREEDARTLGKYAMMQECASCLRSPEEAKKCELHKVLEFVAPLPDGPRDEMSLCEYAETSFEEGAEM